MSNITIGPDIVLTGDFTPRNLVFPLEGKTLFTIKSDGSIERGEGFTTQDEMSLHFWAMIEKLGIRPASAPLTADQGPGEPEITPFELRRNATLVFLAAEESVAKELSSILHRAAREIERLISPVSALQRVPPGWQIVPIQPTPEMLDVADIPRIAAIGVWSNMLKAAPLP